jgi:hypothetical protein
MGAKNEPFKQNRKLSPESQGHNLALGVLHVPNSLDRSELIPA